MSVDNALWSSPYQVRNLIFLPGIGTNHALFG